MEITYFEKPEELERFVRELIKTVDVVLDIGPGIYPINHFIPNLHILVEPYQEYVEILQERMANSGNHLIIRGLALDVLKLLPDNSVDSVFLIDVIEHIEKNEGISLLKEIDRVARQQLIVFTPLGFMPQHIESDKRDRWGLHGGEFQEHKSGWLPEDFSTEWKIFACKKYHTLDDQGNLLPEPFGAIYAVKNIMNTDIKNSKSKEYNFFRPTAKELAVKETMQKLEESQIKFEKMKQELAETSNACQLLLGEKKILENSKSWKITSPLRKISAALNFATPKIKILLVTFRNYTLLVAKYKVNMTPIKNKIIMISGKSILISSKDIEDFWSISHKNQAKRWITGSSPQDELGYLDVSMTNLEQMKILVVGVGTGETSNYLASLGCDVDVLDITDNAFNCLSSDISEKFLVSHYSRIPNENYDLILHHLVAQHMSDENLIFQLNIIINSLKKNGELHMQFASSKNQKLNDGQQSALQQKKGHVLRSEERIKSMLVNLNFREFSISKETEFPEYQSGWCWRLLKLVK